MKQKRDDSINARGADNPGVEHSGGPEAVPVKPKHAGGRKPRGYYERGVQDVLDGSAPNAAKILDEHMRQVDGHKKIKDSVMKIAFFIIDHAIGKARQKVEHSGGVMTYGELAKSADDLDTKPRPILSEVMEIANKYKPETPAPGPNPSVSTDDKPGNEKS